MRFLLGSVLLAVAYAVPFGGTPRVQSRDAHEVYQDELARMSVPPHAIGEFLVSCCCCCFDHFAFPALQTAPTDETLEQMERREARTLEWYKRWTPQFMPTTTEEPTTTEDPMKDIYKEMRKSMAESGMPSEVIEDYIDIMSEQPTEDEEELERRGVRMQNWHQRYMNLMTENNRRDQSKKDAVKEVATELAAIFEKSRIVTSVIWDQLDASNGEVNPEASKYLRELASNVLGEYERVLVEKVLTHTIKKISQKTGVPREQLQILPLGEL